MTTPAYETQTTYTIAGPGPYDVANPYRSGEDLTVTVIDGGTRTVLEASDYTVSPDRGLTGGTVTLASGAATTHAGKTLEIRRDTARIQPWAGAASSREKGIEFALDIAIMLLQDFGRDQGRALVFPVEEGLQVELPQSRAARAGKFLGFDSNGDPVASLSGPTGTPVSSFMETFLAAVSADAGLTALGGTSTGTSLFKAASLAAAKAILELGTAASASTSQLVPSGAVFWFAKNTPPTGYLECNGATVSRTTYAGLFAVIGTTFGAGDGSTTFALPDLRGEFVRGWDNGRGVDSSRTFGSQQANALEAHTHQVEYQNGGVDAGAQTTRVSAVGAGGEFATSGSTGGDETRPRNVALLPCIKT